jgi:hypothetical protein
MGAVPPIDLPAINQPEECLIDQGRGLQSVIWSFSTHETMRHPTQFPIHQRRQSFERFLIAVAPGHEQPGYFLG